MEVEYRRDLHHSYMVFKENNDANEEAYCFKMLRYHSIEGILKLERKVVNADIHYYFDITAKQSMVMVYDKAALSYSRVKQLFHGILQAMEGALDYLLSEDDFLLQPEYVYLDIGKDKPYLCYYPGYHRDIRQQMSSFLEYIMDRVDYKDRDAVYLVYSLYVASKQESFTFEQLVKIIDKSSREKDSEIEAGNPALLSEQDYGNRQIADTVRYGTGTSCENEKSGVWSKVENTKDLRHNGTREAFQRKEGYFGDKKSVNPGKVPVMMEQIISEEEVSVYPLKVYLYTGGCILAGILVMCAGFASGNLYNTFGNRLDYTKLSAFLLVIAAIEGYLIKLIWNKNNRIARIVPKKEYIDPRGDCKDNVEQSVDRIGSQNISSPDITSKEKEEDYNPTCLLNEAAVSPRYLLRPLEDGQAGNITISGFPYLIGKYKGNVDYCLDREAVSRYHAKITMEQDKLYIFDMNSTNGTYLNGELLKTYQGRELKDGDEISFANVKYRFEQQ